MTPFLTQMIQQNAIPFNHELPLQQIIDAIGDAQFVLLGESTHGTAEYYTARAQLSKKLIEEKGFTIIAVEGDWPAAFEVNRYIKEYPSAANSAKQLLKEFNRWPTWMWANEEVSTFVDWLKTHNANKEATSQVGFYGFDLYSLPESIEEIRDHLHDIVKNEAELIKARQAIACFDPMNHCQTTMHYRHFISIKVAKLKLIRCHLSFKSILIFIRLKMNSV